MKDTIFNTVSELLVHLATAHPQLSWRTRCSYTTGQGDSVIEIMIYSQQPRTVRGRIAYLSPSGQVLNYRYAGLKGHKPQHIVDMLLDVVNHERSAAA